jgi:hypothetical protein
MQNQTITETTPVENKSTKKLRKPKQKLMDDSGPLKCKSMPGYHLRWVSMNDPREPTNMQWADGQNYVPVSPKEQDINIDSKYLRDTGDDIRVTGGDGITQILMKQPIEDYEESIKEFTEYNQKQLHREPENTEAVGTFGKTISLKNYDIKRN